MKCVICEEDVNRTTLYSGDKGTSYEGQPLCEICYYDSDPAAVVFYKGDDQPYIISLTRNDTEGDFTAHWRSTDSWRGYYETKSEKYSRVNTAELLAWHESEQMIKSFDDRIRELFDEHDIDYARVVARSSNVFYQNYDLYVRKDQSLLGHLLVNRIKEEVDYNNPKWYRNIVFDEDSLSRLSDLFPEYSIETDYDAVKLIEKLGTNAITELQKRIKNGVRNDKKI